MGVSYKTTCTVIIADHCHKRDIKENILPLAKYTDTTINTIYILPIFTNYKLLEFQHDHQLLLEDKNGGKGCMTSLLALPDVLSFLPIHCSLRLLNTSQPLSLWLSMATWMVERLSRSLGVYSCKYEVRLSFSFVMFLISRGTKLTNKINRMKGKDM